MSKLERLTRHADNDELRTAINIIADVINTQNKFIEAMAAQIEELNAAVFSTRAVKPKDKRQAHPL